MDNIWIIIHIPIYIAAGFGLHIAWQMRDTIIDGLKGDWEYLRRHW